MLVYRRVNKNPLLNHVFLPKYYLAPHCKVEPLGREGETPVWILGQGVKRHFFFRGGQFNSGFHMKIAGWIFSFENKKSSRMLLWGVSANLRLPYSIGYIVLARKKVAERLYRKRCWSPQGKDRLETPFFRYWFINTNFGGH